MKHLYTPQPLQPGTTVNLPPELSHRLAKVLRLGQGASLHLFNGSGSVFAATVADAKCRTAAILAALPEKPALPHLTLALGLPKREAWEAALRQATELGVTHIIPIKTEFSQAARINAERAELLIIEAAEQSERTTLPTLSPLQTLPAFLESLTQPCAWAYERLVGAPAIPQTPHTLLIGPEGGFAPDEVTALQNHPHIVPITLGQTILRTDTAVVAGLARLLSSK